MKISRYLACGALAFSLGCAAKGNIETTPKQDHKQSLEAKVMHEHFTVTRIVDGDTFVIETGGRVRIIGIDTPERNEPLYHEASERLKELIYQKNVVLEKQVSETDRFGRLLRDVYIDNVFVNSIMVSEGYAESKCYKPDCKYFPILEAEEQKAREQGIGIWLKH